MRADGPLTDPVLHHQRLPDGHRGRPLDRLDVTLTEVGDMRRANRRQILADQPLLKSAPVKPRPQPLSFKRGVRSQQLSSAANGRGKSAVHRRLVG